MDSGTLGVPGAEIYYERRGSGPVLLLINGGNGDVGTLAGIAEALADRFTTIAYDRRTCSRSRFTDPPAEQSIEQHADDAHRILREFTTDPSYVFGTGAGASIGMHLLTRHPDRVRLAVAHEPVTVSLLPDPDHWHTGAREIHDIHRREGTEPALEAACALFGVPGPPAPSPNLPAPIREMVERVRANVEVNFAWELRSFLRYTPDFDTLMRAPLIVATAAEGDATLMRRSAEALATRLNRTLLHMPGDHIGYALRPTEFAHALANVLT
jgi:pimeloyl-ACP methyl ester carboxylesterase